MAGTKEVGHDFIDRITAEIRALKGEVAGLHQVNADLRSAIGNEAAGREADVAKLHDRISQERAAETHLRTVLEKKLEDFEAKSKSWIGALGKDLMATKEQLAELGETVKLNKESAAAQIVQDDKRFQDIEEELPKKSTWTSLHKLEADIANVRTEIERNQTTLQAEIRSVANEAARDFKTAQESIECVKAQAEGTKKQLVADLAALGTKAEGIQAFAQTRAKESDLQALVPRVEKNENGLDAARKELSMKATVEEANTLLGRLTSLTTDVQTMASRNQQDKELLTSHLTSVEKDTQKNSRQLDSDRERTSSCIVALEKQVATSGREIVLTRQEVLPYKNRLEALEVAFPMKAEAGEIPRIHLAISDGNARHEAMYRRAQEHGMRIDRIDGAMNHHSQKLEGLLNQNHALDMKVSAVRALPPLENTKDKISELSTDFYRKDEIDAMLSRVWWRVGDVTKGSPLPLSTR
mmetsp:Transcript_99723/g.197781  ORF Transcript_99723/g.197781 Transcript_99723/m.197781 type:complete len:468 (+) Transcript_99723:103-1506(+)|eukprot:CAMPEP_0172714388 /NCGR_PEP_ID=MMETSP1074-20121228/65585_1 /TAXON_ID=2916 /ORGANISM="Ceratium fusus, Strain PA161109" /LENGTH=467 /DNA_ID=CAMNT_0013538785 /DNA_START=86 /DNA_END=1489 /DNA_ORIENTATION=-